ncbi:hypothetical protein BATDEDRAFT_86618 [Batrachochytrium dendrobatidis JAM81]|uniref:Uncharacterized protein n=1 Tax=Batrachochytrium dendrobatidis (strain JAM81 / FGSC 10211) TaxID=684364 RepID=F4NVZ5_BATDJ|nr:uncharacterized protein BATDEDRAFT_86618 [Batrachochytrium dendrobatidis JAM81]EGF82390.1 hypothetical protein BATDEDRAFT_86618 [Batrachochytrium dendrobatidis JAM81]|eukprot:XP_006676906.1 hypothetical protein BATDEDRAFT_86618 [Batrachochytrium dendrobatidis JAM81]
MLSLIQNTDVPSFPCQQWNAKCLLLSQDGPTEDSVKRIRPPDTKELFVYKLLHHIGVGPESHFIIPSYGTKKTIYIATKDCHLVLLSSLTKDTTNKAALLQLDLISRILCLGDCTTNSSNFGQVGEKGEGC